MKKELISELDFCLKMWKEKWGCTFWGWTECSKCATPYLLWKLIKWEVLHWEMDRLNLDNWKEKFNDIK